MFFFISSKSLPNSTGGGGGICSDFSLKLTLCFNACFLNLVNRFTINHI